jgi:hypothetical protein
MTSENIGDKDDLELNAEDADQVVGGTKKKKKAAAHKSAVHTSPAAGAPTLGPPMTQAEMDAYDKDMVDHGLDPVYGTTGSDSTASG